GAIDWRLAQLARVARVHRGGRWCKATTAHGLTRSPEPHGKPRAPDRSNDPAAKENQQSADRVRNGYAGVTCEMAQQAQYVEGHENEAEERPPPRQRTFLEGKATRPIGA